MSDSENLPKDASSFKKAENIVEEPAVEKKFGPNIWIAAGFLVAGAIGAKIANDIQWTVGIYLTCVVLAQCSIDLYKAPSRPYWSAAFRLLALAVWFIAQMVQKVPLTTGG